MIRTLTISALLLGASPLAPSVLLAATHTVTPGEGAQERLQEALILAEPGDEVVLEAGHYALTDGLSLDVDNVTVRGAGMDETVLDFTSQAGSGEGFLITSDNVTVRDFALENPKGDGVKSKGADNIVYHRVRVTWTGGPDATNGAYGIYPVESEGVLIDGVKVSGASDAGIYVGQSNRITVRNSIAEANVAGIEIENSRNALVENNLATRNTGGILVFDLPDLPVMGGGNVVVRRNLVVANDTANFAPPGNIVASVRRGTGILVMANENVTIEGNVVDGNPTAGVMVIAYTQPFEDERYNPYARNVSVGANVFGRNGYEPQLDGSDQLLAAFGGSLPPILWDGIAQSDTGLRVADGIAGWTLGLTRPGQSFGEASPAPLSVPQPADATWDDAGIGAPAELEDRLG
ncbi:parallel beta-helix domain-containing protein [Qipengyuania sp. MTN3-11]|uniref:parallel beta-helix domain-containing protein n=1 Tax=Qipengyuania sp. MTN3-11 TaxID=3056557 RepID=UPI0036F371BB